MSVRMMDISPTCYGYIDSEEDLALVFQGVFDGNLKCVDRRPYEAEKAGLAGSGNIFIFNEEKSGIKRWTDGFSWSPSRISGKFLVYREYNRLGFVQDSSMQSVADYNIYERCHRRHFYTGLLKKTFSLKFSADPSDGGKLYTFHLIAYYTEEDIIQGRLKKPSENPFFNRFKPSQELLNALQKVAVGNGRSNPSKNNERGRTKVHYSRTRRSLSSSSSYTDLLKNDPNPPRNIPSGVSFIDGRSKVQTRSNFDSIIEGQHPQQRQYTIPTELQNQLPFPYAQHPPQSMGIYNARYQPGMRRTVSQPVIFCKTFNPPPQQPITTSCEIQSMTPPVIYSPNKLNSIPYQNIDPYYSRSGPECMRSPGPMPSNVIHPMPSILMHDYPHRKKLIMSPSVVQTPNVVQAPNVVQTPNVVQNPNIVQAPNVVQALNPNVVPAHRSTNSSDGICILPALRLNVPLTTQPQLSVAPTRIQHSSEFSKDSTLTDQKYPPYSQ